MLFYSALETTFGRLLDWFGPSQCFLFFKSKKGKVRTWFHEKCQEILPELFFTNIFGINLVICYKNRISNEKVGKTSSLDNFEVFIPMMAKDDALYHISNKTVLKIKPNIKILTQSRKMWQPKGINWSISKVFVRIW